MADAEEITMDGAKCHPVVHFHQNWMVFFTLEEEENKTTTPKAFLCGHHVFTLLSDSFGKTTFKLCGAKRVAKGCDMQVMPPLTPIGSLNF